MWTRGRTLAVRKDVQPAAGVKSILTNFLKQIMATNNMNTGFNDEVSRQQQEQQLQLTTQSTQSHGIPGGQSSAGSSGPAPSPNPVRSDVSISQRSASGEAATSPSGSATSTGSNRTAHSPQKQPEGDDAFPTPPQSGQRPDDGLGHIQASGATFLQSRLPAFPARNVLGFVDLPSSETRAGPAQVQVTSPVTAVAQITGYDTFQRYREHLATTFVHSDERVRVCFEAASLLRDGVADVGPEAIVSTRPYSEWYRKGFVANADCHAANADDGDVLKKKNVKVRRADMKATLNEVREIVNSAAVEGVVQGDDLERLRGLGSALAAGSSAQTETSRPRVRSERITRRAQAWLRLYVQLAKSVAAGETRMDYAIAQLYGIGLSRREIRNVILGGEFLAESGTGSLLLANGGRIQLDTSRAAPSTEFLNDYRAWAIVRDSAVRSLEEHPLIGIAEVVTVVKMTEKVVGTSITVLKGLHSGLKWLLGILGGLSASVSTIGFDSGGFFGVIGAEIDGSVDERYQQMVRFVEPIEPSESENSDLHQLSLALRGVGDVSQAALRRLTLTELTDAIAEAVSERGPEQFAVEGIVARMDQLLPILRRGDIYITAVFTHASVTRIRVRGRLRGGATDAGDGGGGSHSGGEASSSLPSAFTKSGTSPGSTDTIVSTQGKGDTRTAEEIAAAKRQEEEKAALEAINGEKMLPLTFISPLQREAYRRTVGVHEDHPGRETVRSTLYKIRMGPDASEHSVGVIVESVRLSSTPLTRDIEYPVATSYYRAASIRNKHYKDAWFAIPGNVTPAAAPVNGTDIFNELKAFTHYAFEMAGRPDATAAVGAVRAGRTIGLRPRRNFVAWKKYYGSALTLSGTVKYTDAVSEAQTVGFTVSGSSEETSISAASTAGRKVVFEHKIKDQVIKADVISLKGDATIEDPARWEKVGGTEDNCLGLIGDGRFDAAGGRVIGLPSVFETCVSVSGANPGALVVSQVLPDVERLQFDIFVKTRGDQALSLTDVGIWSARCVGATAEGVSVFAQATRIRNDEVDGVAYSRLFQALNNTLGIATGQDATTARSAPIYGNDVMAVALIRYQMGMVSAFGGIGFDRMRGKYIIGSTGLSGVFASEGLESVMVSGAFVRATSQTNVAGSLDRTVSHIHIGRSVQSVTSISSLYGREVTSWQQLRALAQSADAAEHQVGTSILGSLDVIGFHCGIRLAQDRPVVAPATPGLAGDHVLLGAQVSSALQPRSPVFVNRYLTRMITLGTFVSRFQGSNAFDNRVGCENPELSFDRTLFVPIESSMLAQPEALMAWIALHTGDMLDVDWSSFVDRDGIIEPLESVMPAFRTQGTKDFDNITLVLCNMFEAVGRRAAGASLRWRTPEGLEAYVGISGVGARDEDRAQDNLMPFIERVLYISEPASWMGYVTTWYSSYYGSVRAKDYEMVRQFTLRSVAPERVLNTSKVLSEDEVFGTKTFVGDTREGVLRMFPRNYGSLVEVASHRYFDRDVVDISSGEELRSLFPFIPPVTFTPYSEQRAYELAEAPSLINIALVAGILTVPQPVTSASSGDVRNPVLDYGQGARIRLHDELARAGLEATASAAFNTNIRNIARRDEYLDGKGHMNLSIARRMPGSVGESMRRLYNKQMLDISRVVSGINWGREVEGVFVPEPLRGSNGILSAWAGWVRNVNCGTEDDRDQLQAETGTILSYSHSSPGWRKIVSGVSGSSFFPWLEEDALQGAAPTLAAQKAFGYDISSGFKKVTSRSLLSGFGDTALKHSAEYVMRRGCWGLAGGARARLFKQLRAYGACSQVDLMVPIPVAVSSVDYLGGQKGSGPLRDISMFINRVDIPTAYTEGMHQSTRNFIMQGYGWACKNSLRRECWQGAYVGEITRDCISPQTTYGFATIMQGAYDDKLLDIGARDVSKLGVDLNQVDFTQDF